MVRRSVSWFAMVTALVLLGPGLALATSIRAPEPWAKRTPDGRFELSLNRSEKPEYRPRLSLRDRKTGALLWANTLEDVVAPEDAILEPGGGSVLVIARRSGQLLLYGPDGNTLGTWKFDSLLTHSEVLRLPTDRRFGKEWVREAWMEGEVFVLLVPVGAPVGRAHESRYVTFQISARPVLFIREPQVFSRSVIDLIRLYRRDTDVLTRVRIADELWGFSQEKGAYELPRFWSEMLSDPKTPRSVLPIAVEGMGFSGGNDDLRTLARLSPGELERDAAIFKVLARKLPEEAGHQALGVLEQENASPYLRALAFQHLFSQGGTAAKLGQSLLQRDAFLREPDTISLLTSEIDVTVDFWQALPFCADPNPRLSAGAARSLERLLRSSGRASEILIDVPASEEGTLSSGCPQALLLLGAIADRKGDMAQASRLYASGVMGLERRTPEQRRGSEAMLLDSKLRLAFLTKEKGDWNEVRRLAQEVLAHPARSTSVCAPLPAVYGPDPKQSACDKPRSAEAVARPLLREAQKNRASAPGPN